MQGVCVCGGHPLEAVLLVLRKLSEVLSVQSVSLYSGSYSCHQAAGVGGYLGVSSPPGLEGVEPGCSIPGVLGQCSDKRMK